MFLIKRCRGETYEIRQARLSGAKKDRLDRHMQFKKAGDECGTNETSTANSSIFYAKKKLQGSEFDAI